MLSYQTLTMYDTKACRIGLMGYASGSTLAYSAQALSLQIWLAALVKIRRRVWKNFTC